MHAWRGPAAPCTVLWPSGKGEETCSTNPRIFAVSAATSVSLGHMLQERAQSMIQAKIQMVRINPAEPLAQQTVQQEAALLQLEGLQAHAQP